MVDLLAGLPSGAAYHARVEAWDKTPEVAQDRGHVFIAIDTTKPADTATLTSRMADFIDVLHAADPARPVMLPGEREIATLKRQRQAGARVKAADLARLRALVG